MSALLPRAGSHIANAHTRYGEASPLNADGDFTCTGTTTPDINEVPCDKMSDACNVGAQSSCTVRYHNDTCGAIRTSTSRVQEGRWPASANTWNAAGT